jgi:hypothetical protein
MSADLPEIADHVLVDARFREALDAIMVRALSDDLPRIDFELLPARVDWRHALLCASVLTSVDDERTSDAALRVAQACLTDKTASAPHRRAAAVVLDRLGNRRAIELGEKKEALEAEAWTLAPAPLQLDVIRRRIELSVTVGNGERLAVNPFQRSFWTEARRRQWLSVSAPTSAGKSYIVRRWFEELVAERAAFRGVYLVPTRALIDEVSRELRANLEADVGVFVLPWDRAIGSGQKEIYVVTQERLHMLQQNDAAFAPDFVFVDEAQKIGDGARGVLLQTVLDEAARRRPTAQVIFASPSSRNPELLLDGAPPEASRGRLVSEMVTVNQNLLWVNPAESTRWTVELVTDGAGRRVGTVDLHARPSVSRRLPLVALALGRDRKGNVVYVNGAAAAETAALEIAQGLRDEIDLAEDPELTALQELVATTVHRSYRLVAALRHGVAFHYGNMPLLVRTEIERLFRAEKLHYLVCTSTLLEGVNLPCRTLFARAPERGRNRPMSAADFWNLAGRAGRWGVEFRGNIVCVDATPDVWASVPARRERPQLERAADPVLAHPAALEQFISAPDPATAALEQPMSASVFSFLAGHVVSGRPLQEVPGLAVSAETAARLEDGVRTALQSVELPADLIVRHAGVSPTAMQRLLERFRGHPDQETLAMVLPDEEGARLRYAKILSRCSQFLGATQFRFPMRAAMLGMLVRDWMRGYPLARIIEERMRYIRAERPDEFNVDRIIRETMDDVEDIARFAAPKYMACYHDIYAVYLRQAGQAPRLTTDELTMMLELGVSRPVEVVLMGLGLSRTTAVSVSPRLGGELRPVATEVLAWLRGNDLGALDLPRAARREIEALLAGHRAA